MENVIQQGGGAMFYIWWYWKLLEEDGDEYNANLFIAGATVRTNNILYNSYAGKI